MAVEVRTYAGLPPVAAFASTAGTPIVIDNTTNTPYYLAPGDVVTAIGGGGGGFANPMTTAGDIIVGGVAGAPTRYGATTDGFVLTLSGGTPAWSAASGGVTLGQVEALLLLPLYL